MTDLPDGIYFDLSMDAYVALPRLGAHGLNSLLVSAATYWANSHLNTTPREVSDAVERTRMIGAAYHCARLEPEHFNDRYVRELDKAEMPEGTLFTGTDMGAELAARDLKKSGSVAEQAERLIADGFPAERLWQAALAQWEDDRGERVAIPAKTWDEIVQDGERLRASPEVAALLDGGYAEVSILWTDDKGVRCKCRPDKLRADQWLDLKTFANVGGKHVEQAIADAIRYNRYHVGAAHYRDGIEAVRSGAIEVQGNSTAGQREMVAQIRRSADELNCWYVFQEKGGIPNIIAKRMRFHAAYPETSMWFDRARAEVRAAKKIFATYSEVYEPGEPWLPFNPLGEVTDGAFSQYWLEEFIP